MKHIQASFQAAVEVLVGEGPVKKRLCLAFEEHLVQLEAAELPGELRDSYRELHASLHAGKPVGPQSRVQATVQKMSSADAAQLTLAIFAMHLALEGQDQRSEPLRVTEPLKFAERAIAAAPRYLEKQG